MNPRTRRQRRQARKHCQRRNTVLWPAVWAKAPRRYPWGDPKQKRSRYVTCNEIDVRGL